MKKKKSIYFLVLFLFIAQVLEVSASAPIRFVKESVSTEAFPEIELTFRLEAITPGQRVDLLNDNFSVKEEGKNVDVIYEPQPQPIKITYILLIDELGQLSEGQMRDTYDLLWRIVQWPDAFRLCFTLGTPSCTDRTSADNDSQVFFEQKRNALQNSLTKPQADLSDLIRFVIAEAEVTGQTPIVVVQKSEEMEIADLQAEMPESIFNLLAIQKGTLIFIDEAPYPEYGEAFQNYLYAEGAIYLPARGTADPLRTRGCKFRSKTCFQTIVEAYRNHLHVLHFRSKLFQDVEQHLIHVSYEDQTVIFSAWVEVGPYLRMDNNSLHLVVRWVNAMLALCSPLALIILLVLTVHNRQW